MSQQQQSVLAHLDAKGIPYRVIYHDPVYTIEEMEQLELNQYGEIAKNLFLRNSNGKTHFLVMLCHDKTVNLKELRKKLESSALSFASEERLQKYLGLTRGAVSPLGILNNHEKNVIAVFDNDLKKYEQIGVHPNDNTATLWLTLDDILRIVTENGNEIRFLDFD